MYNLRAFTYSPNTQRNKATSVQYIFFHGEMAPNSSRSMRFEWKVFCAVGCFHPISTDFPEFRRSPDPKLCARLCGYPRRAIEDRTSFFERIELQLVCLGGSHRRFLNRDVDDPCGNIEVHETHSLPTNQAHASSQSQNQRSPNSQLERAIFQAFVRFFHVPKESYTRVSRLRNCSVKKPSPQIG